MHRRLRSRVTDNDLRNAAIINAEDADEVTFNDEENFDSATDSEVDNDDSNFDANNSDSDGESSAEEDTAEAPIAAPQYYMARDQTEWQSQPLGGHTSDRVSRNQFTIVHIPPGQRIDTIEDCFRLIFDDEIIEIIVRYTNIEARKHSAEWKDIDRTELLAFIGLLFMAGVERSSKRNFREFYDRLIGLPLFKACMSRNRLQDILRFIRFDDKDTRSVRRASDKLAPIRDVFEMVVRNLKKSYSPGEFLTVDEQLVPFRGRCAFKQYIPSKPDKYGIKIFWICDAKNWYPCNATVYLGRERSSSARRTNIGYSTVMGLCEPYYNSRRNITFDNFFTSYDLARDLKNKGLTSVGTVRKNKKFIPKEFLSNRHREIGSNLFGFRQIATLVSHVPKRNKAVLFLSTRHHTASVNEEGKSEVNLCYNSTKAGVDILDQLSHTYSVQRSTERWPFAFFMILLNVAGVAAFAINRILNRCNEMPTGLQRKRLLYQLSEQLTYNQIKRRAETGLSLVLRTTISNVLNENEEQPSTSTPPVKRRRCAHCPPSKNRKIKQMCQTCKQNVCKEHATIILKCKKCAKMPIINSSDSE